MKRFYMSHTILLRTTQRNIATLHLTHTRGEVGSQHIKNEHPLLMLTMPVNCSV